MSEVPGCKTRGDDYYEGCPEMINRTYRFHGHGSLHFVYTRGQTVRGSISSLKYALNNRRQEYRAAVVVSRKVHKSAVIRNRIRRRVYEIVRAVAPEISEPYDIVFTIYSDTVAEMPRDELAACLRDQLNKAGILGADNAA